MKPKFNNVIFSLPVKKMGLICFLSLKSIRRIHGLIFLLLFIRVTPRLSKILREFNIKYIEILCIILKEDFQGYYIPALQYSISSRVISPLVLPNS